MIKRELYLKKIRPFYESDMIKVLVGIRRSGKSTIIKQIIDEIDSENIIYVNFEDFKYNDIKTATDLNDYITSNVSSDKYYLFFDEIQVVEDWELAINSFRSTLNVSIFITGSNSKLLSGELATNLAGRYVSFEISPFSFPEYIELTKNQDVDAAFNQYIIWGGMPQSILYENEEEKRVILMDIYNSIILKDIIARHKVTNVGLFERIIEYIVTNPSQTFSATSIRKYLEKENIKVSNTTLYTYISYLQEVFLIKCARSYDIRGKRILDRQDKYYLTDLGLGQIRNQSQRMQVGSYIENIVYNHLLIAGYNVYVGKTREIEVDFIASKGKEKKYIQVAYLLADDKVIEREFRSLKDITDNHPKYVLSMDKLDFSQDGIIHQNIIDFIRKLTKVEERTK
ncbi:MAG: ATP-binding protein [Bacilli bacterium]